MNRNLLSSSVDSVISRTYKYEIPSNDKSGTNITFSLDKLKELTGDSNIISGKIVKMPLNKTVDYPLSPSLNLKTQYFLYYYDECQDVYCTDVLLNIYINQSLIVRESWEASVNEVNFRFTPLYIDIEYVTEVS